MSIREQEVLEVVVGQNDVFLHVYALDEEGERTVELPVAGVNTDYRAREPGRITLELFSYHVVTTREVDSS